MSVSRPTTNIPPSSTAVGVPAGNRWAIVISSSATKQWRQLDRSDNILDIVQKKLKELSQGLFSADNHRLLVGSSQHVPVYRARVAGNLRIVYHIDVLPDASGIYDHQVIKVLQIVPRARVDYNFWVKASVRLKRVNPIYRERGTQEKCRPAMFPHLDYGLSISNQDSGFILADLGEGEMDKIQEITMERFAPLNKSLFNSVAADLNIIFPMILDEHERKIVSHTGASIVIGRSGTGKTTALIYKIRAIDQTHSLQGASQLRRQLFVTRSHVLAQHVESTYQGLVEFTNIADKSVDELKEIAKLSREDPDRALVEFDSEVDLREDLPERFSALSDSHFPLFLSFDKASLCSLLEADIRHVAPDQISSLESRVLIGFDDFLHRYWPSFRGLSQGLEPNLVYSEIIGVIKGSQAAFESKEGYLSRTQYVDELSHRQFPLLAQVRTRVYAIFELYTRNKRSGTDPADRTRLILQNLPKIVQQPNIDYLYIDEVQDNLMIDIHLLRALAKDINNIYWSGDSAQTVVAGSAFRINDLKAFTYRDLANSTVGLGARKTNAQFTSFELNVNFRSLSGIVKFAGFVVESIHKLFPEAIDVMEEEKAKHYGDPPILFTNIQNETGYFEKFLLGSSASNRVVFGAQQAILVRDTEAAEDLDARLQGLCNILPIMDSKGLEFDDVLIYDFFSKSAAPPSAWAHLFGGVRGNQAAPPVLCSELKLLYVAVTRARRRCWIWDSGQLVDGLKNLWLGRGLIQIEPANRMISRIASSSSKTEWAAKGREYFTHRLYKLAAACFRQAEQENDAELSLAYHSMARAKLKRLRGDSLAARTDLISAAVQLETCARLPGTGNASNVHYHAATCYESAREFVRASTAFVRAERYAHAVQILFDARDFNNGARVLVEIRTHLEAELFQSLREQARQHFFGRREYSNLASLFDTIDEKVAYARNNNFKPQLKHILDEHQRFDELATEYLNEDNLKLGVECYVKAYRCHRKRPSISRAVKLSLDYVQSVLLVEGVYQKTGHELSSLLLSKVQPYAGQSETNSCKMVDLFYNHLCLDRVNLDMAESFGRGTVNPPESQFQSVLASYFAIKNHHWMLDDSADVIIGYLKHWRSFKNKIIELVELSRPSSSTLAQKLLGFSEGNTSGTFIVLQNSMIYQHTSNYRISHDDEIEVPANDVDAIIREELPKRLYVLLDSLHTAALSSPWTRPFYPSTSPIARPHYYQNSANLILSDMNFAPKLHILCEVLVVLDTTTRGRRQRDYTVLDQQWLRKIFNIAYSSSGEVGCFAALHTVPNSKDILECLGTWLRRSWDQLRNAEASGSSITHMLLYLMVQSSLGNELLDSNSHAYMKQATLRDATFNNDFLAPLRGFFFHPRSDPFDRAIDAIERVLDQSSGVNASVVLQFVERITREIMLYKTMSTHADFDLLLLPFSWMRALAHEYPCGPSQSNSIPLDQLLSTIERISLELRFGKPRRWEIECGSKVSELAAIEILNLRLCWCVALLIGHIDASSSSINNSLRVLKRLSDDEMPPQYNHRRVTAAACYRKFSQVSDQDSCLEVLCRTLQHETLVLLLESPERYHPAMHLPSVRVLVCSDPSKLVKRLEALLQSGTPDSSDDEDEQEDGYPTDEEDDYPAYEDYYPSDHEEEYDPNYHYDPGEDDQEGETDENEESSEEGSDEDEGGPSAYRWWSATRQ